MARLIIATRNQGKVKEIKELLNGFDYEVVSLLEAGIDKEVLEDGSTFEENAAKKAAEIRALTGGLVLADDSGLEVDFLNGAPGVYSARFMGDAPDYKRYEGILALLDGIPDEYRTARFVCVASLACDKGILTFKGTAEGRIAHEPRGTNGFGYDPVFYVPEYRKTVAEMGSELKNLISHRGKAFKLLANALKEQNIGANNETFSCNE